MMKGLLLLKVRFHFHYYYNSGVAETGYFRLLFTTFNYLNCVFISIDFTVMVV